MRWMTALQALFCSASMSLFSTSAMSEENMKVSTDTFQTKSGKSIQIQPLIHASLRITYDGREIEIDPVAKMNDRTTDYGKFPKADVILVTHEHFDHLDKTAIQALKKEKTQVILNKRSKEILGAGEAMSNGDQKAISDDFKLEAVPAYNTTEGHLQFHPKGRDNGYILTLDGFRIYIAGDTEDIPEMVQIKDIDVAFLPCNQPYTMTKDQWIKAVKTVKPKTAYPYHFSGTDVSDLPELLKKDGIEVRVRAFD